MQNSRIRPAPTICTHSHKSEAGIRHRRCRKADVARSLRKVPDLPKQRSRERPRPSATAGRTSRALRRAGLLTALLLFQGVGQMPYKRSLVTGVILALLAGGLALLLRSAAGQNRNAL